MNGEEKRREGKEKSATAADSPSELTVSEDDEIDYSVKPEFYDSDLDDKDELWVHKKRGGRVSDAVLSCPACFTTLCLDCQRHETNVTQYRAVFVINCKIKSEHVLVPGSKRKRGRKGPASSENDSSSVAGEAFKRVCCSVCSTEVGVMDDEEIYHFLNVLPSEA